MGLQIAGACAALMLACMCHAQGVVIEVPPVRVEPAQPASFERVELAIVADSCSWNPATVRVAWTGTRVRVTAHPNQCLVAGRFFEARVQIGAFPAGDYGAEADFGGNPFVVPFSVRDPAEVAVVPPPARPLTNYTGLWWTPWEPGWGLSLHQSPLHVMFGALYVYDAHGQPQWYTLQGGQWTSATTWTGTVYRTTGTPFADPAYLTYTSLRPAGTATLDFSPDLGPGVIATGEAAFTYTIDGTSATKLIERMPF